jgi:hypothetical protein
MARQRSVLLTLIIIVIALGAGVVYSVMNSNIASDNLSASLSLPELAEDLQPPEAVNVVEVTEAEVVETESNLDGDSTETRDPQVAGEIAEGVALDNDQRQMDTNAEISPTAETGLGSWSLLIFALTITLGLLGLYLAPKFLTLR